MLTTTSHDSVLLRADDPLIDMNYITSFTGMTDKWFYKLISEGHFLNPSNWGAAAAGTKVKWSSGCSSELRNHEEQQHETCCNASTLAMCEMPALVLWKSALSPVLALTTPAHLSAGTLWPANCLSSFPD